MRKNNIDTLFVEEYNVTKQNGNTISKTLRKENDYAI